jgi:lipid-A-disaccharide synthase
MTLLPDEGRWFEPHGLHTDFVGHPVVERAFEGAFDGEAFRREVGIPLDATLISVLPGSRHSEVKRLLPILKDAVVRVARSVSNLHVVVPTVPGVEAEVRRAFEGFAVPTVVVTGEVNRYKAFTASRLAIAKSGTVSLELAAIGVPHMIVYTFGRVSDFLAVRLIKVPFANLLNLMSGREIIPEFVLQNARAELIAECAERLLSEPQLANNQVIEARQVMQRLRLPDILPSQRAAEIVLEVAKTKKNTIK